MKKMLCALSILSAFVAGQADATPFGFATNGATFVQQGFEGFNYGGGLGQHSWVDYTDQPLVGVPIGASALGAAWNNNDTNLTLTRSAVGQTFNIASLSLNTIGTKSITIQGLLSGNVVDSWTGIIKNQAAYTDVDLNWIGIDTLTISQGSIFLVTNLNTSFDSPSSNVPEPASLSLAGLGLLAFAVARRSSRSAKAV